MSTPDFYTAENTPDFSTAENKQQLAQEDYCLKAMNTLMLYASGQAD
ncbi:DUF2594 family protein, partial [Klebsiella pneumoniae]